MKYNIREDLIGWCKFPIYVVAFLLSVALLPITVLLSMFVKLNCIFNHENYRNRSHIYGPVECEKCHSEHIISVLVPFPFHIMGKILK